MKNKKARFDNLPCFSQKGFQKRAQAFSVIFVVITAVMCISSVLVYMVQQKNAESSLVSPLVVLAVRDNLTIFEMREKELIEKSLVKVKIDFTDDEFAGKFKDIFIEGLDGEMKSFILSDLIWQGKMMGSVEFDKDSFFRNVLYSEIEMKSGGSGGLKFVRSKIGKSISLRAGNPDIKVNFPVDFLFEFEREYLISRKYGKFEVEAVW